jgi:phosphoserine phosphatase
MLEYAGHPVKTIREGKGWNRGYLRGLSVSVLEEESSISTGLLIDMVRPSVLSLLKRMETEGSKIFLLSASIATLVHGIGQELGFSGSVGSVPQVHRGRCTGRLAGLRPWGADKVTAAGSLLDRLDVPALRTLAMGDSWSDRHLMDFCGGAVAVAPGGRLRALASERGWEIIEH